MGKEEFDIKSLAIDALIVLTVGGALSTLLGAAVSQLETALAGLVVGAFTVLMVVATGYLLHKAQMSNFINLILLFGMAVGFGQIIGALVPVAKPFLLVVGDFGWVGFFNTLFYVALADYIGDQVGY